MADSIDQVFGYPQIVRFSWATTKTLLESKAHKVTWNYGMDNDEKKTTSFMKRKKSISVNESDDDENQENIANVKIEPKLFGAAKKKNSMNSMGLSLVSCL